MGPTIKQISPSLITFQFFKFFVSIFFQIDEIERIINRDDVNSKLRLQAPLTVELASQSLVDGSHNMSVVLHRQIFLSSSNSTNQGMALIFRTIVIYALHECYPIIFLRAFHASRELHSPQKIPTFSLTQESDILTNLTMVSLYLVHNQLVNYC